MKESEINFDDARIEKIKKYFNEIRIKEIPKGLYRIENKKIFPH